MSEEDYEIIEIELPIDVVAMLAIEAHNRDMKLNDLITEILLDFCKQTEINSLREEYNCNVEI